MKKVNIGNTVKTEQRRKIRLCNTVKTEQRRKIRLGNTVKTEHSWHSKKKAKLKGITRVKEKGRSN